MVLLYQKMIPRFSTLAAAISFVRMFAAAQRPTRGRGALDGQRYSTRNPGASEHPSYKMQPTHNLTVVRTHRHPHALDTSVTCTYRSTHQHKCVRTLTGHTISPAAATPAESTRHGISFSMTHPGPCTIMHTCGPLRTDRHERQAPSLTRAMASAARVREFDPAMAPTRRASGRERLEGEQIPLRDDDDEDADAKEDKHLGMAERDLELAA